MTKHLTRAAVIAAIYAALSLLLAPLSFGPIQLRPAEALTVLAASSPAAGIGVTIGCFLTNLASPYGMIDIVFGTLATGIAAVASYASRKFTFKGLPILSALCPVIFNGIIIGGVLTYTITGGFDFIVFAINAAQIALSQAIVCLFVGLPLYKVTGKIL